MIAQAEQTHLLTQEQLLQVLTDPQADALLFAAADRVRQKYVGDEVHLRALIEFTNICKNNCLYCGLQCQNKKIARYRLSANKIISLAKKAVQYGYKTAVL
ncbi:MAG: [FeFe] hydrogenase H-cluster radical SAM maturase HydE, partial [Alphaproteobacteria bacterium]|nr:[FeFe] hydrogenase H-cluster radical SAM maturase HydE [Alphaproteobacteria bacterium]